MDYVRLTHDNLESEHICCALSSNRDPQVAGKKAWLAERFDEGLTFLRSTERGKCFIEYLPAEKAWVPVEAEGCMHIDCFWVSGSFSGHGYANDLIEECIRDSRERGMRGITVISSPKKKPFLSDRSYLEHKGFMLADEAEPYFELLYLPLEKSASAPRFAPQAKKPHVEGKGFVLYYTSACPFTVKYSPILEASAQAAGIPFECIHLQTCEQARNAPVAWTNFALFYDGDFITHEILSEKKFLALAESLMGR